MAKKQTRRSVSIRGTTYQRVRDYCDRRGISMSELVEESISKYFQASCSSGFSSEMPVTPSQPVPPAVINAASGGQAVAKKLDFDEMQDAARSFTF